MFMRKNIISTCVINGNLSSSLLAFIADEDEAEEHSTQVAEEEDSQEGSQGRG